MSSPNGPDALRGISLEFQAGDQLAVIGPSGAGKTSLLQVLACALRPAGGELLIDGQKPWQLTTSRLQQLRGKIFLAPQVPPLPSRQRVVTAVLAGKLPSWTLFASLKSLVYPSDIASAHQALSCFGLEDKLFERVDRLSGGERQRVGLARALVAPAKVWFVDEPLSSLDPSRASQAIEQLTQIARARGTTLVASLHQVDTALASFSRVIGLRHGSIMFDLPASKVTDLHLSQLYEQTPSQLLAGNRAVAYEPSDGETKTARPLVLNCR